MLREIEKNDDSRPDNTREQPKPLTDILSGHISEISASYSTNNGIPQQILTNATNTEAQANTFNVTPIAILHSMLDHSPAQSEDAIKQIEAKRIIEYVKQLEENNLISSTSINDQLDHIKTTLLTQLTRHRLQPNNQAMTLPQNISNTALAQWIKAPLLDAILSQAEEKNNRLSDIQRYGLLTRPLLSNCINHIISQHKNPNPFSWFKTTSIEIIEAQRKKLKEDILKTRRKTLSSEIEVRTLLIIHDINSHITSLQKQIKQKKSQVIPFINSTSLPEKKGNYLSTLNKILITLHKEQPGPHQISDIESLSAYGTLLLEQENIARKIAYSDAINLKAHSEYAKDDGETGKIIKSTLILLSELLWRIIEEIQKIEAHYIVEHDNQPLNTYYNQATELSKRHSSTVFYHAFRTHRYAAWIKDAVKSQIYDTLERKYHSIPEKINFLESILPGLSDNASNQGISAIISCQRTLVPEKMTATEKELTKLLNDYKSKSQSHKDTDSITEIELQPSSSTALHTS